MLRSPRNAPYLFICINAPEGYNAAHIYTPQMSCRPCSLLRKILMRLAGLCLCFALGRAALLTPTSRRLGHVNMKLSDDGILGVGVIGAGRIGLVHLEALSSCENAKAVIISNPTVSKAEAAATKFKLDTFSGDAMEVINHPDVEAGAPPACAKVGAARRACARGLQLTRHARTVRSLDLLPVPVPRRSDQGLCGGWQARLLRCAAPECAACARVLTEPCGRVLRREANRHGPGGDDRGDQCL